MSRTRRRGHRVPGDVPVTALAKSMAGAAGLITCLGLSSGAPAAAQPVSAAQVAPGASRAAVAPQDASEADDSFTPIGAHFGAFMFYPKLETSLTYNDNIYALENRIGDEIARISPSFDLQGDLGQITTDLRATVDRYQYVHQTGENRTDWSLGGNGQIELHPDMFGYLAGGYSHAHEDRGDPNAISTSRAPTSYYLGEAGAGLSSAATRLHYGVDLSLRDFNYRNGRQIGGAPIANDDRDRQQYRASARIGYEFSPGYTLLARGSYERVAYDRRFSDAAFKRDSEGFRGTLGVDFALTHLLTGEVFAGYLRRTFDDPGSPAIAKPVFGSSLSWTPNRLLTITLNGDRTVQETITSGYSSFVSTSFTLAGTYNLLRMLTLDAQLRYSRDQYERQAGAFATGRHDEYYGASAGARYHLNRNLYAGLSYEWLRRDSNVSYSGVRFTRNRLTATVGLQF